ncbi:MAG: quinohemoprotein amine dehydrogenase subunit alpha [Gammaproteobacteria bacterium]
MPAVVLGASLLNAPAAHAAEEAESVLNGRCAACHQRLPDGGLSRISEARRTPEGWDMSIVRMMLVHGVEVTPEERRVLVKHLADSQGLAPAETSDFRYILERRPDAIESPPDEEFAAMCGRCHSFARVALQRRDADEWTRLAHFHLGQYPTTEYQALGRDRNWWEIASKDLPPRLAELYPFATEAWSKWQAGDHASAAGEWRVVGHRPGKGSFEGIMTVSASGDDAYDLKLAIGYADGEQVSGSGSAIVYTGFEWRARVTLGDQAWLHVAALDENGNEMSGRAFLADADSLGAELHAARTDGSARVLSVSPPFVRVGETVSVAIHGVGLDGAVSLGEGVDIVDTAASSSTTVTVRVNASGSAGARTLTVGDASAAGLFTVYDKVEAVRVVPDYAIARVGGNNGPLPAVPAQFDAVAYLLGADGQAGTDDDVRIGVMPAEWSVSNNGEAAEGMNDVAHAGQMSAHGLFNPAGAGLNPGRRYSTNNVGDLSVNATVTDGDNVVEGSGRLIVTVQRWNDPPIR